MTTVALVQCEVFTGDLESNARNLKQACLEAQVDLCIAAVETLAGPDAHCCRREPDFGDRGLEVLGSLAVALRDGPALLCGSPDGIPVLLEQGQVTPLEEFFRWRDLGIALTLEPRADADVALNLHGRPFTSHAQVDWELVLSGVAQQLGCWCLSVNLVGGGGQYIYNGQSVAAAPDGQIRARARAFAPDWVPLSLEGGTPPRLEPLCSSVHEAQWLALTLGVRAFMRRARGEKAIVGLSGGMDSALVAAIAQESLGGANVLGVLMPSPYSSSGSVEDALKLAQNLQMATTTVPITPMFESFRQHLAPVLPVVAPERRDLTEENLQARIRGVILMALANRTGALVLNTGNKSESAMGYNTLYGDTVGAVAVIGDLFKTQVYELGRWFNAHRGADIIPEAIFTKEPSAELAPGQKDSDSLPPYAELDEDLAKIFAASPEVLEIPRLLALRRRVQANAFKRRQCPPALLVTGLHPCDGPF